jgi:hypothetical protein
VMGRYVPQLKFLDILLGDRPVLEPSERFYQRLLAMNPEEAEEILRKQIKETNYPAVCDTILLPALNMAEQDRAHNGMDDEREKSIFQNMREIVDDIPGHFADRKPAETNDDEIVVLCLPAQDQADEIAAQLFSEVLRDEGMDAQSSSALSLTSEQVTEVENSSPGMVCISAVPPSTILHARYLCKRMRARFPKIPILVGIWNAPKEGDVKERLKSAGCDQVVTTFADGLEQVRELIQPRLLEKVAG